MRLRVLTDTGLAIDEPAVSIVAPGEPGYLGILRNHAPLVTTLTAGTLRWTQPDGGQRVLRLGGGLLEVARNHVTILTDRADAPQPVETRLGI